MPVRQVALPFSAGYRASRVVRWAPAVEPARVAEPEVARVLREEAQVLELVQVPARPAPALELRGAEAQWSARARRVRVRVLQGRTPEAAEPRHPCSEPRCPSR